MTHNNNVERLPRDCIFANYPLIKMFPKLWPETIHLGHRAIDSKDLESVGLCHLHQIAVPEPQIEKTRTRGVRMKQMANGSCVELLHLQKFALHTHFVQLVSHELLQLGADPRTNVDMGTLGT